MTQNGENSLLDIFSFIMIRSERAGQKNETDEYGLSFAVIPRPCFAIFPLTLITKTSGTTINRSDKSETRFTSIIFMRMALHGV
jgi:hypothetical protein